MLAQLGGAVKARDEGLGDQFIVGELSEMEESMSGMDPSSLSETTEIYLRHEGARKLLEGDPTRSGFSVIDNVVQGLKDGSSLDLEDFETRGFVVFGAETIQRFYKLTHGIVKAEGIK